MARMRVEHEAVWVRWPATGAVPIAAVVRAAAGVGLGSRAVSAVAMAVRCLTCMLHGSTGARSSMFAAFNGTTAPTATVIRRHADNAL